MSSHLDLSACHNATPSDGVNLPKECHSINASSGTCSRFLLSSRRAASLVSSLSKSAMKFKVLLFSSETLESIMAAASCP